MACVSVAPFFSTAVNSHLCFCFCRSLLSSFLFTPLYFLNVISSLHYFPWQLTLSSTAMLFNTALYTDVRLSLPSSVSQVIMFSVVALLIHTVARNTCQSFVSYLHFFPSLTFHISLILFLLSFIFLLLYFHSD